jgi:hypothetical protein
MSKNKEAGKITLAKAENARAIEIAKKFLASGSPVVIVAENTDLSLDLVLALKRDLDNQ